MNQLASKNHTAEAASQATPSVGLPSEPRASSRARSTRSGSGIRSSGLSLGRQLITLDVKDGELRFVVFRKGRVVRWGMVTLDGDGENREVTTSQLGTLKKELGLKGRWVVSLPLRSALVRRFVVPRMKRRYLGQVVASEVAERIPFPIEQVDLAWAAKKAQKGHQIVAIAVSKGVMDRIAAPLKAARLKLSAMYPRATALAYMAGASESVVVDLGATSADVVLVESGIPRLVHEVELAAGPGGEAGAAISQAVEQVAIQHHEPEEGEKSIRHVLVTGNSSINGITREEVERRLGRDVLALHLPLKLPEHFSVASYAANLGLFLAYQARPRPFRKASQQTLASVNVLPERHRPRSLPLFPAGVFLSITLFAYAAVGFHGDLSAVAARRDVLASRVAGMERQERLQRLERLKAEADKKRATATEELANKVEVRLGQMSEDMKLVMADLDLIYRWAPSSGVLLTGVTSGPDGYSVSGNAASQDELIAYARRLRLSQAFQDVAITSIQSGAKANPGPDGESVDPGTGRASFQLKLLTSQPAPPSK